MRDLVVLVSGGAFGVLVGWLMSRSDAPLERYRKRQTSFFGAPLSVEKKQMDEHFLKRFFVAFPLILGVMFAVVASVVFGSGKWVH
jgi:hypothetical protein